MKKYIFTLMAMMTMVVSASAMSYSQAREQALFLTDKMAYELNLNDAQYEAAYEINLDYLMGINTYDDLYGVYWTRRNMDLSYPRGGCGWCRDDWSRAGEEMGFFRVGYNKCRVCALYI